MNIQSVETIEARNLILKTNHINASTTYADYYNTTVTTTQGIIANNFGSFTWYNVCLKDLLGDMYYKYDKFNICLLHTSGCAVGTAAGTNQRVVSVNMSGLSFQNTYDQTLRKNSGKAFLSVLNITNTANASWSFVNSNKSYHCFIKSNDYVNITIDLLTTVGDAYPTYTDSTSFLGHMTFTLAIYGIDE